MVKRAEVLTEPIKGYRGWNIIADSSGIFLSNRMENKWLIGKPLEAKCQRYHHRAPNPYCHCGIYAVKKEGQNEPGYALYGEVMLWGKYVRHTGGWRGQFAYPSKFTGIGCVACGKVKPISRAKGWVIIYIEESPVYNVDFICGDCFRETPVSHLFVPASYFVESLERAYQLGDIERGSEDEHRGSGEGRHLHSDKDTVASEGTGAGA